MVSAAVRVGFQRCVPKTYVCWQGICDFSGALFLRLTGHFPDLCRGVLGQARYGLSAFFTLAISASISFFRQSSRHAYDNRSVTSFSPPMNLTLGLKSRVSKSTPRKVTSKPCFHSWVSSFCQSSSCLSGLIRCRDSITIPARPPTDGRGAGSLSWLVAMPNRIGEALAGAVSPPMLA